MRKRSSNNVVEINGQLYDAQTGLPANTPVRKDPTKGGVIDGFVKQKKQTRRVARPAPTKAQNVHATAKKTTTLHRAATQKPATKKHHQTTAVSKKKLSIPHQRKIRATQTAKSPTIAKFSPQKAQASQATHTQASAPAPKTQKSQKLVQKAMQQSTAHIQPVQAKKSLINKLSDYFMRRPRALSLSVGAVVLLLVAGYVTYLNVPNLALRVAAREAGFEANMPGYQPNGYGFAGPISYEQGRITLQYDSRSSDEGFEITQRQTNWDSQSLLDNYVVSSTDLYQTYQERGLTIYVYNGSEATWVNGGIWYSIEGDSQLNAEQLIRIASSL